MTLKIEKKNVGLYILPKQNHVQLAKHDNCDNSEY